MAAKIVQLYVQEQASSAVCQGLPGSEAAPCYLTASLGT